MRNTWTRDRVIREILDREAGGKRLTAGGEGFDHCLYCAARRIFGSWRNAVVAAGIPPGRARSCERWSPAQILTRIRVISRRGRPLTIHQIEQHHCKLVSAARRQFGSWSKALVAAGVDPVRLRRVVPWNKERVVEAILTRALRGESLVARLVETRSLVEAAQRFFGDWPAAVAAAGLDPKATEQPPRRKHSSELKKAPRRTTTAAHRTWARWSQERVIEGIRARVREHRPVNAFAVYQDQPTLYSAAFRHLKGWDQAMRAAGLEPDEHRCRRVAASSAAASSSTGSGHKSQGASAVRPEQGG